MNEVVISEITDPSRKSEACRAIIQTLPEWFGLPGSNENYIAKITDKDVFGAQADEQDIGLIALRYHFEKTAEIWWMGIRPDFHHRGIGSLLFERARERASERGCRYMAVETVSVRSPDEYYARTRAFYERLGFLPLLEFNESDPVNPMVWMLKEL